MGKEEGAAGKGVGEWGWWRGVARGCTGTTGWDRRGWHGDRWLGWYGDSRVDWHRDVTVGWHGDTWMGWHGDIEPGWHGEDTRMAK